MIGAWVGQPLKDTDCHLRRPGWVFVQDFLNTHPTHPTHPAQSAKPQPAADLLADRESAQRWLDGALKNWSQETGVPQSRVLLTEANLDELRGLRADLTSLLRAADQTHDAICAVGIPVRAGGTRR